MFYIITSIVIVLFTLYLPSEERKIWTRRTDFTHQKSFIRPITIPYYYYDDVFDHIDNSHYYAEEEMATAGKYKDAKERIKGWKGVYARLKIQYQHVLNAYQRLLLDKECADFLRDYIPSVERDYLQHRQGFKSEFKKNNPFFTKAYYRLDRSLHKIYEVYEILGSNGLRFENRTICSFEYMSAKEYNGPVPEPMEKCPPSERNNLNKCEQWIFFLDAVKKETSTSRSSEIKMWQKIIKRYEEKTKNPYPIMVQNILHALYWSHQYNQRVQSESADTGDEEKCASTQNIFNPKKMLHCMYEGLLRWQSPKKNNFYNQNTSVDDSYISRSFVRRNANECKYS